MIEKRGLGQEAEPRGRSLLAPFDPELFVEHRGWEGLLRILSGRRGGSYGISGPRGAGKTWMMEKARKQADEEDGVGVWFPSPSEYEPIAFLSALSDVVAARFEAYYDKRTGRTTRTARWRFTLLVSGGFALSYLAAVALVITRGSGTVGGLGEWFTLRSALFLLVFIVGVVVAVNATRRYRSEREGLGRVRRDAEELRRQVRYTVNATESEQVDIGGAYSGIGAKLRRARERQLVERPATLSSLIHNFRAFAESIAMEIDAPVVISVDELDKMSDATRVAQLLRDIKGIFDIPGVYFFVSLSDEAARSLDLGAVRARNEFNSSFYAVISLSSLRPEECVAVLQRRDDRFDEDCALTIAILTAGLSREVVRIAERVMLSYGEPHSVGEVAVLVLSEEVDAFLASVLQTTSSAGVAAQLGDAARLALFEAAEQAKARLRSDADALLTDLGAAWDLNAANPIWRDRFAEEWRRLLVRLGVAALVIRHPEGIRDRTRALELQRLVALTSTSAIVGRTCLEVFAAGMPESRPPLPTSS